MSENTDPKESIEEKDKLKPLYWLLAGVFVIWIISYLIIYFAVPKWDERGTLGDAFGLINSLFSGCAFAGIIFTILLQRKELRLQREELRLQRLEQIETRKELKRSAEAQEKSEEALRRQAENLRVTARLNALSTLINYYSTQLLETYQHPNKKEFKELRDQYVEEIRQILENKPQ